MGTHNFNYTSNEGFSSTLSSDTSFPLAAILSLCIIGYILLILTGVVIHRWMFKRGSLDTSSLKCCCGCRDCCLPLAETCNPQLPAFNGIKINCCSSSSWKCSIPRDYCDCCCFEIHLKNTAPS